MLGFARGEQSGLVDQVGEIGARETRRAAGDGARVHVRCQRHLAHVYLENPLTPQNIWIGHHHLTVEAARAQQRRIEHVGTVGGGNENHTSGRIKAVHLDQQLVEGLFALVIAAAEPGATMPADSIDLVDEDDAGRVLATLLEHVAHTAGTNADEHLDEIRAGDGEEGHIGLAGDGTC